ncbi:MAG: hypothetical protein ACLPPF_00440, partial [Rhodomicrobium sp.]
MTAASVVSLLAIGGSFLAVGTPMRDSLQSPTRGGLKRPQPLRLRGIKSKFPDIMLHGLDAKPVRIFVAPRHGKYSNGKWAGLSITSSREDRNFSRLYPLFLHPKSPLNILEDRN